MLVTADDLPVNRMDDVCGEVIEPRPGVGPERLNIAVVRKIKVYLMECFIQRPACVKVIGVRAG